MTKSKRSHKQREAPKPDAAKEVSESTKTETKATVTANAEIDAHAPVAPKPQPERVVPLPPDITGYLGLIRKDLEGGGLRWRADTPACDGWYPAGHWCDPLLMAYWDGHQWSECVDVLATPERAQKMAAEYMKAHHYEPGKPEPVMGTVFWSDGMLDKPRSTFINRNGRRMHNKSLDSLPAQPPPQNQSFVRTQTNGHAVRIKKASVDVPEILTKIGLKADGKPVWRVLAKKVPAPVNPDGIQATMWDLFDAANGKLTREHLPKVMELTGFNSTTLRWNFGAWKRYLIEAPTNEGTK